MFTGLVQHLGRVASLEPAPFGARLVIDASGWGHRPGQGDSISVNGCCLTVVNEPSSAELAFDVIRQTLEVTTLGQLRSADQVNLEHAATPQTMLGGHIVQGHIDAVGTVIDVKGDTGDTAVASSGTGHGTVLGGDGGEHRLRIAVPDEAMDCIVEKGSIAVNGVSLTVAGVNGDAFDVALIPTTLELTNLGRLKRGDRLNLETDYLAKVIVNYLRRRQR